MSGCTVALGNSTQKQAFQPDHLLKSQPKPSRTHKEPTKKGNLRPQFWVSFSVAMPAFFARLSGDSDEDSEPRGKKHIVYYRWVTTMEAALAAVGLRMLTLLRPIASNTKGKSHKGRVAEDNRRKRTSWGELGTCDRTV